MLTQNRLRVAALLLALVAGSCSDLTDPEPMTNFEDGAANHPLSAEPSYRALKLPDAGELSIADETQLENFIDEYLARGSGAISVSVPAGPNSSQIITAYGERIASLGVPRTHILVGIQEQPSPDGRAEIGFISYEAHIEQCGNWSVNAADTGDNTPMPNFGCAVQHNIAAEVADPRDLAESRGLAAADAARRMQVLNKYEQAQTTGAQKTNDQSGKVSDVGSQ